MENIGMRIKNRRKEIGMSAEKLAEIMNVSPTTIYRYESNFISNMGLDKLELLANALKTSPAYLMGWDDKQIDALKEQQAELEALDIQYDANFKDFMSKMYELQLNADEMEQLYLFAKFLITRRRNG